LVWGKLSVVEFEQLGACDLQPGTLFLSGTAGTIGDDPISKVFKVGNAGGFRARGSATTTRFVVLFSNGQEELWPDADLEDKTKFVYYGDNKAPNSDFLVTPHSGNQILRRAFNLAADEVTRSATPIFALVRKTGSGRDATFIGLGVPSVTTGNPESGLEIIETRQPTGLVRNYRATFELLPVTTWLRSDFENYINSSDEKAFHFAPKEYKEWALMTASQTHESQTETVELDIRPDTSMLDVFENITYTPWFALGELVDNSISSFMEQREAEPEAMKNKKLVIKISWDSVQKIIRVEDNAGGIKLGPSGWDRVLKVGKKKPNARHLSVFGYGLKAAGLWWSPKLTVESKVEGETVARTATIDRNNLAPSDTVELISRPAPAAAHYTRVTLTGLNKNRSIPVGGAVSRIQDYLSSMYRVFLRGDKDIYQDASGEPWLEIKVQNTWLKAPEQELLVQPFWPTTNGPLPDSAPVEWRTPEMSFNIVSRETGTIKTISGWVGLLKVGKPNDAGFLMLFRGKGIVGVGQGVGSSNDLYRPANIVGSGNTNRRQRMVGEFDISDFGKSVTTDAIDWSDEEQADFLQQLESRLKDPNFNIWAMAENWRPTKLAELPPSATTTYENAAGDTVEAVEKEKQRPGSVLNPSDSDFPGTDGSTQEEQYSPESPELAFEKDFEVAGTKFRFVGALAGLNYPWLSVFEDGDTSVIQVNQDHPFMRSFAFVPGHDPKSLYRLAMAIALAEIKADPTGQRNYINDLLDGPIGSSTWDEDL
jgi:hypothetical protein